jgi:hypothetical protein
MHAVSTVQHKNMTSAFDNTTLPDQFRQFHWSFPDLGITSRDMAQYLGFEPDNVPDPFPEMIEAAFREAPDLFEIRTGYTITDEVRFHPLTFQTETGDVFFSTGSVVFNQIRKADRLALFAATAGHRVTGRCRELNLGGNSVYSYVLDVMGSLVAGKSADRMLDDLERELELSDRHISESYSPGYCDWSVAEQHKLFSFFPPGFLGITLSPSSLMTPVKSVSGIVGIGQSLKRNGYQCFLCNDKDCRYGKIRREKQMK